MRAVCTSRYMGYPIRPSRDQCVSAASPGLSWLATAFIAPVPQGIRLRALIRLAILVPSGLPTHRTPPSQADGFTLAVRPDFSSSRVTVSFRTAVTCLSFPSLVISNSRFSLLDRRERRKNERHGPGTDFSSCTQPDYRPAISLRLTAGKSCPT